jgi:hypothetical protein
MFKKTEIAVLMSALPTFVGRLTNKIMRGLTNKIMLRLTIAVRKIDYGRGVRHLRFRCGHAKVNGCSE